MLNVVALNSKHYCLGCLWLRSWAQLGWVLVVWHTATVRTPARVPAVWRRPGRVRLRALSCGRCRGSVPCWPWAGGPPRFLLEWAPNRAVPNVAAAVCPSISEGERKKASKVEARVLLYPHLRSHQHVCDRSRKWWPRVLLLWFQWTKEKLLLLYSVC